MPNTRQANAVRLEFGSGSLARINLSGAAFTDDRLWLVGDEAAGVERLQRLEPVGREVLRFGDALTFPLADVLDLPGADGDEADLEGLAACDGWLWLVGSHGLKRKNAKANKDDIDNAKRLTRLALDGNRRLLARVPIERGADGAPRLVREASDGRRAMRLKGDAERNVLIQLLEDDPHIAPFLDIPGKDNGFDIEGLALMGSRLLVGLRGPVLRGWTMLLELAVEAHAGWLRLAPLSGDGALLRKHFLQLGGLGVRDLHFDGDDLFILAGPTMVLDGDIRVFRWQGARSEIAESRQAARFQTRFAEPVELPHTPGANRAEALCALPDGMTRGGPSWLVLYDAPGAERREGDHVVFGDLLRRD